MFLYNTETLIQISCSFDVQPPNEGKIMTLAQILHSIVSFICMENTGAGERRPQTKSQTGVVAPQAVPSKGFPKIASLADAVMAYRRATGNSALEQQLSKEVMERAHGPDDWTYIAEMISASSDLRQLAVDELATIAASFDQYKKVHQLSGRPAQQSDALDKMVALAGPLDEKLCVYELVGADSQKGEVIFQELTSETRSCEEWTELFENADADSPLERFAAGKVVEMTDTPEALAELACNERISEALEFEPAILAKLRSLDASFDVWHEVADSYDGTVGTIAVEKMIETATTLGNMLAAEEKVDEDDGTEEKLILKAESSFAWTDEHCRKVIDEYDDDNVLFSIALKKLTEMATTTEQCLRVYLEWQLSDENNAMVLGRLLELSTASERVIIALVSEEDSELQEWAQTNA